MASDIAISLSNVDKDFRLPTGKASSVKDIFIHPFSYRQRTEEVQHALKDISFNVKKGEFFGIVGRNGSGKSTLLKLIAGIYQPTKGKIGVDGRLVPFIELGVGFNPDLTGKENVYLNGALLGFSDKEIDEKYDDIVAFAELEMFMGQKLNNYSSGMQVRLAFSVATVLAESDILLIDEVLAVGDADFQRKCFDYFKALKRLKKTVVFVTHDMTAVVEYCDRAILIDDTEMLHEGKPEKIARKYEELFTSEEVEDKQTLSDNTEDWGDKRAAYSSIKVSVNRRLLRINCIVKSNTSEDICCYFGFRIRNQAGQDVCGINTRLINKKDAILKAGDSAEFTWELPNILSDGTYSVINSISESNGKTIQFVETPNAIKVRKTVVTGYPVQPDIDFKVKS